MASDPDCIVRLVAHDAADFAVLAAWLDAELEDRYPGLNADGPPPRTNTLASVVAYRGEAPLGCAALCELAPGVGEIRRMFVVPEARRHGVARQMLQALEAHARDLGLSAVRLGTGVRQPEALALYESCGYRRVALFGEYDGTTLCVCFEKTLV